MLGQDNQMNREEIIIGGFGGQGIILAGFIVGKAASIFDGRNVTLNQSYGPEARGGDCHVQVIISDNQISYPYIDNPSILVVMSQEAYDKGISSLRQGAPLLIDEALVKPEQATTNKIFAIPATSTAQELGRKAVANIVMLGFLTAVTKIASIDAMKKSVLDSVPKGTEELNMEAFERGYAYGVEKLSASEG